MTPAKRRQCFAEWQAYRNGWQAGASVAHVPLDSSWCFAFDLGYRDGLAARQAAFAKARERYEVEEGE